MKFKHKNNDDNHDLPPSINKPTTNHHRSLWRRLLLSDATAATPEEEMGAMAGDEVAVLMVSG